MNWAKDLTNIAVLFIFVAALALLVSHSAGTSQVISAASTGFGGLLSTVENPGTSVGDNGNSGSGGSSSSMPLPSFSAFSTGGMS